MKYAAERPDHLEASGRGRKAGKVLAHVAFVAAAFGFFAYAVADISDVQLATASVDQAATAPLASLRSEGSSTVSERLAAARFAPSAKPLKQVAASTQGSATQGSASSQVARRYGALFDPQFASSASALSGGVVRSSDLQMALAPPQPAPETQTASVQVASADPSAPIEMPLPLPRPDVPLAVASVPLPMARPAGAKMASDATGPTKQEIAAPNEDVALATPEPKKDSIFQKLFGTPWKGPTLAFASPDGGIFSDGSSQTPGKYDRYTAVYDISHKVVYLPDGRKLEAHSGLGSRLDDPRFVHERMRGPTPPHLYDLALRESLFHGVKAIRLKPVGGESAVFGRTGLLAHTYMLGPNGDSNGCVSFRNYEAFLRAFESGQVKRLAVVASLS